MKPASFVLPHWAIGTNVYEVNIRQYTHEGTINAFAQHLPRLKNMGIQTIWLMPITPISVLNRIQDLGSYYAASSYTEVSTEFGTLDDFKNLVENAHKLEMKVIIDWVANHTGCDHEWTIKHKDWYLQDENGHFVENNGWTDVIDLNYRSEAMQIEMIKSMQFWVETSNIDGFRCDMAHLVPLEFWIRARYTIDSIKPLLWLAECESPKYHFVFNISYAWWWMHESQKLITCKTSLFNILQILKTYQNDLYDGLKLFFTSNHDENSWNGTDLEKYGEDADTWTVFCITWQGIPLIYSGQEIPNSKRLKFFTKDTLDWSQGCSKEFLFKTLLHFRNTSNALKQGSVKKIKINRNRHILAYSRQHENQQVIVFLNFSNISETIQLNDSNIDGLYLNIFSNHNHHFTPTEIMQIPAHSYRVFNKL